MGFTFHLLKDRFLHTLFGSLLWGKKKTCLFSPHLFIYSIIYCGCMDIYFFFEFITVYSVDCLFTFLIVSFDAWKFWILCIHFIKCFIVVKNSEYSLIWQCSILHFNFIVQISYIPYSDNQSIIKRTVLNLPLWLWLYPYVRILFITIMLFESLLVWCQYGWNTFLWGSI